MQPRIGAGPRFLTMETTRSSSASAARGSASSARTSGSAASTASASAKCRACVAVGPSASSSIAALARRAPLPSGLVQRAD